MKKKILYSFIICLLFVGLFVNTSFGATITLQQIADKFNNCSAVKQYATFDVTVKANTSGNDLIVSYTVSGKTINFTYTLNGNILSAYFNDENAMIGYLMGNILIDCIGQLNGYAEEELYSTLNSSEIYNYTLEKEGLKVVVRQNVDVDIKVDITKKIPLLDFSNTYFTVSDLNGLKQFIEGDGFAQQSKGKVTFHKSGYDNNATLIIAEQNSLTQNAYKSVLSILEVMFNSPAAADYFKANYPTTFTQNKEFKGIKIEVNPTKNDTEKQLLGDTSYKFARITIDRQVVEDEMKDVKTTITPTPTPKLTSTPTPTPKKTDNSPTATPTPVPGTPVKNEPTPTANNTKLPKTGTSDTILILSIAMTIISVYLGIKNMNIRKR